MGVLSDLVSARRDDLAAVVEDDEPSARWDGFSYRGLDNVKICTLLSLVRTCSPHAGFEAALGTVDVVSGDEAEEGRIVFVVEKDDLKTLATVGQMDDTAFAALASQWGATDEFEGWSRDEVNDLLRQIGDLAESAELIGNCLFLWIAI
jgi:hypothetical protein